MQLHRTTTVLATLTAAIVATATLPSAMAAPPSQSERRAPAWQRTVSPGPGAPFQVAFRGNSIYYSDGAAGTVSKVRRGADQVVVRVRGELAGVDFWPSGKAMAYTSMTAAGKLLTIKRFGHRALSTNLGSYEFRKNPDGRRTYGIVAGGNPCAREALGQLTGGPATYRGIKDSHPYQVTALPGRKWAVADAAGNTILRVGPKGGISTLAVLPPQRLKFTAAQVAALGAPDCLVGVTYAFEPVPTDVERGPNGSLYVSTLPGGPEDPSLGARGSVYRISQRGAITRLATGFLGATNLAVTHTGVVYVTELFKGQVTRLAVNGKKVKKATIANPVSVEVKGSQIFVGALGRTDDQGMPISPGQIARFPR